MILGCISVGVGDGVGARSLSGSGGAGSVGGAGRRPNKLFTYSILQYSRYVGVGARYVLKVSMHRSCLGREARERAVAATGTVAATVTAGEQTDGSKGGETVMG